MSDYDTPKIPPATPPTIDDRASAKDARTKADAEGDSEEDGSRDGASSTKKEREIAEANRAISRGNAKDGAGEQALDSMQPETLLPPD